MLDALNEKGSESGSSLHDGLEPQGWFGWDVEDDVLTIEFTEATDDGPPHPETNYRWKLVPLDD